MKNQKQTIRKIVGFLNNPDEEGGFWLPNIQRPFVWDQEQIARLFDSILREYPISTLLIWKTTSTIRRRKFIDNWRSTLRLTDFYEPENPKRKCLVLDGQQRLQSLFIALKGSYEGKELYFDILSGEVSAPDDVKYRFEFRTGASAQFPWIKFKDLIWTERNDRQLARHVAATAGRALSERELDKIDNHLTLVSKTFKMDESITYQELDSIDTPELYSEDDVVEVFIRANSGGTRLGKSDLLFSLLAANWEEADVRMEALLEALNKHGFAFTRDFVLKTCLTLLKQGAQYEVEKFRKPEVKETIEACWEKISDALRDVVDFIRGKTFLQSDKAVPTYLVMIPLVYVRYHFPNAWKSATNMDSYLLRCSLAGVFGGNPDRLINSMTSKLDQLGGFNAEELFGVVRGQGRSLELTESRFWQMGYGSDAIHLLFNLWYRDFNHTPAYDNNLPQIDHIFPQSLLRKVKKDNPQTGRRDLLLYKDADRNQLANCMLLSREENGAGGKGDTPPAKWFADKNPEYLDMHLIPRDPALWELERFPEFIDARKRLIRQKFGSLLVAASEATQAGSALPPPTTTNTSPPVHHADGEEEVLAPAGTLGRRYPQWTVGTPHTNPKAVITRTRTVANSRAIRVANASYRNALLSGVFELLNPSGQDPVVVTGSGKRKVGVVCAWHGVTPRAAYPSLDVTNCEYQILDNYSGEVADNIS